MQIGPNITDVGFLDNKRLEYFGEKRKTMLYSMTRHFVLRLISIPQQIMIFKFQICIHRPMSNRFFIITKDLKTYTLTKNEFKEHTVFDQITQEHPNSIKSQCMGMVYTTEYNDLRHFLHKFIILPQKFNILHLYALSDQSSNFQQALDDGHFYFENRENKTPLTLALKSQSYKVTEVILKNFQENKCKMT